MSFNPCFIGTYSFTFFTIEEFSNSFLSFNPCFIGTYSFTVIDMLERKYTV